MPLSSSRSCLRHNRLRRNILQHFLCRLSTNTRIKGFANNKRTKLHRFRRRIIANRRIRQVHIRTNSVTIPSTHKKRCATFSTSRSRLNSMNNYTSPTLFYLTLIKTRRHRIKRGLRPQNSIHVKSLSTSIRITSYINANIHTSRLLNSNRLILLRHLTTYMNRH